MYNFMHIPHFLTSPFVLCFCKPGFHIIVRVVPVAPVFLIFFETIDNPYMGFRRPGQPHVYGSTGTTLTRLWFHIVDRDNPYMFMVSI